MRNWVISGGLLLLAYAAFDDITTDNATSFTLEYAMLAIAAAWFAWLAFDRVRRRSRHA